MASYFPDAAKAVPGPISIPRLPMPAIPPANRKKSRLVFLGSSKSMQQLQENGDSFK
jgi:hypothetical protein